MAALCCLRDRLFMAFWFIHQFQSPGIYCTLHVSNFLFQFFLNSFTSFSCWAFTVLLTHSVFCFSCCPSYRKLQCRLRTQATQWRQVWGTWLTNCTASWRKPCEYVHQLLCSSFCRGIFRRKGFQQQFIKKKKKMNGFDKYLSCVFTTWTVLPWPRQWERLLEVLLCLRVSVHGVFFFRKVWKTCCTAQPHIVKASCRTRWASRLWRY